jgi:hypothetical protein
VRCHYRDCGLEVGVVGEGTSDSARDLSAADRSQLDCCAGRQREPGRSPIHHHKRTTMQWQTVITAIGTIADLVSAATALILLIINQRGRGILPSGGPAE